MKLQWFSMAKSHKVFDEKTGEIDFIKSWKREWICALHDPIFWVCVVGILLMGYFLFAQ